MRYILSRNIAIDHIHRLNMVDSGKAGAKLDFALSDKALGVGTEGEHYELN